MLPGSPNGRISSIGEAIFQDIKNVVLLVQCVEKKISAEIRKIKENVRYFGKYRYW